MNLPTGRTVLVAVSHGDESVFDPSALRRERVKQLQVSMWMARTWAVNELWLERVSLTPCAA